MRDALHLVEDPQALYATVPNDIRRHLNQAFYERLYIDDMDVADDQRTPLFADLEAAKHAFIQRRNDLAETPNASETKTGTDEENPRQTGALRNSGTDSLTLAGVFLDTGSSKNVLVGLTV